MDAHFTKLSPNDIQKFGTVHFAGLKRIGETLLYRVGPRFEQVSLNLVENQTSMLSLCDHGFLSKKQNDRNSQADQ